MKIFRVLLLLFPLLIISNISDAQTQTRCESRENIVEMLKQRAGEAVIGVGLVNPTKAIEIFVNKETDTWTIIGSSLVDGKAQSCILYYGKMWITFEEPVGDPVRY